MYESRLFSLLAVVICQSRAVTKASKLDNNTVSLRYGLALAGELAVLHVMVAK